MSSTASAAGDVLPKLPPIRTTTPAPPLPPRVEDAPRSSSSSSTAPDAESRPSEEAGTQEEEAEEEPTTPTWEGSRLRPPTECPLAPRKPAWAPPPAIAAKRKFPATTPTSAALSSAASQRLAFSPVKRVLFPVFQVLPPKKRIRAG